MTNYKNWNFRNSRDPPIQARERPENTKEKQK
jgi:hypothetical protein